HPLLPADLQDRYRKEGLWTGETFFDVLERAAVAAPADHLYLGPDSRTYGEVFALARALAAHLLGAGVKPGDGVVAPLVNGVPVAVVSAAVAAIGGRLAPLPSRANPAQVVLLARSLDAPAV